jgi:hypothetical protein
VTDQDATQRRYARFLSSHGLLPVRRFSAHRTAELQLGEVERQIDRKRENIRHAGDALTRERAERRIDQLERQEQRLRETTNPPFIPGESPDDYPEPLRCRVEDCDERLRDRREAYEQAGYCRDHHRLATEGSTE